MGRQGEAYQPLSVSLCLSSDKIRTSQGHCDRVQNLVLDEADRLFDDDFLEQTDALLDVVSGEGQARSLRKAMFSATVPSSVEEMARSVMAVDTVRVTVGLK
jgi:ATP-dependent RNA helicase DDX52/ROK1